MLLCPFHHHRVHHAVWVFTTDPDGRHTLRPPTGAPGVAAAPPLEISDGDVHGLACDAKQRPVNRREPEAEDRRGNGSVCVR